MNLQDVRDMELVGMQETKLLPVDTTVTTGFFYGEESGRFWLLTASTGLTVEGYDEMPSDDLFAMLCIKGLLATEVAMICEYLDFQGLTVR